MSNDLPAAIDAEKCILGAVLMDPKTLGLTANLNPEDFHLDGHRRVFSAMRELATQGATVDMITLPDYLRQQGDLSACGGVAYLATLPDGLPRRPELGQYVRMVQDKAALRAIIRACESTSAQAYSQLSVSDCMNGMEEALLGIESRRQGAETYHISQFMPETIMGLKRIAESNGLEGFTTGVGGLDEITTGIRKGELWVIGGLPNSGKTPLGTQIAMTNARAGIPAMIFSLEMSRFQLASRIIAEHGVIPAKKLRRPRYINTAEWAHLYEAERELSALPVWVNDASQIKLSELLMRAKLAIRMQRIELVIVDYLMLIDAPGRELRNQADTIAKGMKALAKSERVAVVLLSQFKRPANLNDRPNLTWFKESGGIEATANTCLAVHRPVGEDEVTPTGEDEIIITKNREGDRGSVPVTLNEKELRFYDRQN